MEKYGSLELNESKISNDTTELTEDLNSIVTYVFSISAILLVIFFLGIIFNLISFLSILFGKKTIQPIKLLILNLALADLIYILGIPLFLSNIIFKSWPLQLIGCQLFYLTDFIGMIVGVYTITALSVERFFEVADEKRRLDSFSNKFKILMISIYLILVWLFAILFSMPMVFSIRIESLSNSTVICTSNWSEEQINIFFAIKFVFMFIFPYSIITISSVKLLLFLNKWKQNSLLRNLKQMTAMKTLIKYTRKESNNESKSKKNSKSSEVVQHSPKNDLNEIKKLNDAKSKDNKTYGLTVSMSNAKLKGITATTLTANQSNQYQNHLHPDNCHNLREKRNSNKNVEMTIKINSFNTAVSKQNRIRRKASRIVLLIVLLFFIQWIPLWLFELYKALSVRFIPNIQLINVIITLVSYSNSISNPALYMFITFNFKKFFINHGLGKCFT